ncbi:hypothetical protein BDV06DRAFT_205516 [Aspergillus oleicola]
MTSPTHPSCADYTILWLCALPIELEAATLMLDETFDNQSLPLPNLPTDLGHQKTPYQYVLGRIGEQYVVIACLRLGDSVPESGTTAVLMQLLSTFTKLRFGLMVGIGVGVRVPRPDTNDRGTGVQVRLGDVVVSQPGDEMGGLIQYGLDSSGDGAFHRTGTLNQSRELLSAVDELRGRHSTNTGRSQVPRFLHRIRDKGPYAGFFARPSEEEDFQDHDQADDQNMAGEPQRKRVKLGLRSSSSGLSNGNDIEPVIHYGLIASVEEKELKDNRLRGQLAQDLDRGMYYCVETQAARVMNIFQYLVIRGITDYAYEYADSSSHRATKWQAYAAAAAAAYTKELLLVVRANGQSQVDSGDGDGGDFMDSDSVISIISPDSSRPQTPPPPSAKVLYEDEGCGGRHSCPTSRSGFPPWNDLHQVKRAPLEDESSTSPSALKTWKVYLGDIVTVVVEDSQFDSNSPISRAPYAKVTDLRSVGDGRYMIVYAWLYTRDQVLEEIGRHQKARLENINKKWPQDSQYKYILSTNRTVTLWDTVIELAPGDVVRGIHRDIVYVTMDLKKSYRYISDITKKQVKWMKEILELESGNEDLEVEDTSSAS